MIEEKTNENLLKRSYTPFTDWRPVEPTMQGAAGRWSAAETREHIQKRMEALEKSLEPLAEDAKSKMRQAAALVEEAAGKSSVEARRFLSNALETLAAKLKP